MAMESIKKKSKLQGIDFDKLLMRFIEFPQKNPSLCRIMKYYWNTRFFSRFDYKYSHESGNQILAVYSDFYYREDHLKIFKDFVKEYEYIDTIMPEKKTDTFDIKRGLSMMVKDVFLWKYVKKYSLPRKTRMWILMRLGLIVRYEREMFKLLEGNSYQYVLVYNDSCAYENILVQRMKEMGIRTGTLQHGKFDLKGNWKGLEYRASVADDFLAWNMQTKDAAKDAGLDNVKVLGIPRYIHKVKTNKNIKKRFCVVLSEKALYDENCQLLDFANKIANEFRLEYYVRKHPADQIEKYSELFHKDYYVPNMEKESVVEMCENSDFCIIGGGTSMVIDLVYLQQPFYEYNDNQQPYRNNTFQDIEQLKHMIQQENGMDCEDMFEYYCTTYDVKDNYDAFFKSVLEEVE